MSTKKPLSTELVCPCGNGSYSNCCAPFHLGEGATQVATTAEKLMRSRYSAYVMRLSDYLLATWAPETRPESVDLTTPPQPQWLGLKVLAHEEIGDSATVEFIARYKVGGRAHRLQEKSRFRREGGRWYYIDGEFAADA